MYLYSVDSYDPALTAEVSWYSPNPVLVAVTLSEQKYSHHWHNLQGKYKPMNFSVAFGGK